MPAGSLYSFVISLDDKVSKSAKEAGEKVKGLGEVIERASKGITVSVAGITNAFASLKEGNIAETVQSLGESFAGMAKMLDLVVPGLGQAVSALIEVGSLMGGIFIELAQKGAELSLEAVEAKEKLETLFDAMGAIQGGKQTIQLLDNLSGSLGMTREKLAPLATQFMAMGYTTLPELRKQLTAAASATALMGEAGGQAYVNLAKKISITGDVLETLGIKNEKSLVKWDMKLAGLGVTFEDLAKASGKTAKQFQDGLTNGTIKAEAFGDALKDALTEKGEKPLEKMAESFDFIKEQAKSLATHLFENVDIKPFIDGIKELGAAFGTLTPAGQALKFLVEKGFNFLFRAISVLLPYVTKFFLQLIIWSLKAYLLIKHHWEGITILAKVLGATLLVVAAFFGLVAGSIAVMIAAGVAMTGVVAAVIAGIVYLGYKLVELAVAAAQAFPSALKAVETFATDSWDKLKGWADSASVAAASFIEGLVTGIEAGISKVTDSVANLGHEAADALKKALGISSPSKVMFEAGVNTGQGFADGLDESSKVVSGASVSMAGAVSEMHPTQMQAQDSGSQASPSAGAQPVQDNSSSSSNVFHIDIKIDGAGKDVHQLNEEMVATVFERLMLSQGL